MQDTIRQKILAGNDSLKHLQDTLPLQFQTKPESVTVITAVKQVIPPTPVITDDTISVCPRNPVADVTFHDSSSFIHTLTTSISDRFAYTFTSLNREASFGRKEMLIGTLKEGNAIPAQAYRADWIVPVVLFSAFLFAIVRTFPGNLFRNMIRFLLLRGINENASRDTGVIFQWQATLLNLSSFISISLFGFLLMKHSDFSIPGINGLLTWVICLGIVAFAITSRHFICNITGSTSGEQEIFREYLVGIYHGYHAAGIVLLILSILILYTDFLPSGFFFTAGLIAAGFLYMQRIVRLLLIFITRHVSIFYLILYLCALEILPVVIIVKYITGLV